MDAAKTTIPPGEARVAAEARELVALRRRAYGVDADITQDPVALARLDELETRQLARLARATVDSDAVVPAESIVSGSARASSADIVSASAESTTAETSAPNSATVPAAAPDIARRRTRPTASRAAARWRAAPRWVIAAVGVVVGALVASLITVATAGGGVDATLGVRADQDTEGRQVFREYGGLDYLGVSVADLVLYDEYRGLDIWSAPSSYGTACLIATYAGDGQRGLFGGAGCAPPGMMPIIDLQSLGEPNASELFDGLPTGSLVRLTLDGDRVRVQMGAAPEGGEPVVQQP